MHSHLLRLRELSKYEVTVQIAPEIHQIEANHVDLPMSMTIFNRLLKSTQLARSSVNCGLKMLIYCVYTALFLQILPCLALT